MADDLARWTLLLGNPELSEQLSRGLSLKGALPQYLGSEFEPSVTIEDFTRGEFDYLRRRTRLHQGITVAALAANFSSVCFEPQNTVTSRVMAVVQKVVISNPNAAAICAMLALGPPSVATVQAANVGSNPSDDRLLPAAAGGIVPAYFPIANQSAVGALSGFGGLLFDLPANSSIVVDGPFVLTNKSPVNASTFAALMVAPIAVNQGIRASFIWTERSVLPSEA